MISVFTVHCRLNKLLRKLGLIASDECRFWYDLAYCEDIVQLLNDWSALDRIRQYSLGMLIVNREDFGKLSINGIKPFLGWKKFFLLILG